MSKTLKVTTYSARCSHRGCENKIGVGGEDIGVGEAEGFLTGAGFEQDKRGNWWCPRHKAVSGGPQASQAVPDATTP